MAITYQLGDNLYINLTNRCSNNCKFCVRNFKDGVGGYNLWLNKEPTAEEVIKDIGEADNYKEIIFCGYGEPLIRIGAVIKISSYLKENYPLVNIRINTNGQANLIHNENILPKLEGLIDKVSVSLNASSAAAYQKICQSKFGEETFLAVLDFIKQAKKYLPEVIVSVVSYPEVDVEKCKELARELGVKFKLREY